MPRHCFTSVNEQRMSSSTCSWLLSPETIAFEVPNQEIDKAEGKFWTHWKRDTTQFLIQFHLKMRRLLAASQQDPQVSRGPAPDS